MKKFIFILLVAVTGWSLSSCCNSSTCSKGGAAISSEPARPKGQTDVIGLRCEPIPVVRMAFIGLGMRGPDAVSRFMYIDGIEVKAICDLEDYNIERVKRILERNNRPKADVYTGEEDWKKVCERDDIDLVYVCTHWTLHAPIAIYAMEHAST